MTTKMLVDGGRTPSAAATHDQARRRVTREDRHSWQQALVQAYTLINANTAA